MKKAIVLSRVSTLQQDFKQQTEEILREVYKDGFKEEEVIYMVIVSKPSKGEAVIKLYNKLNNEVHIYEVDCWKHHWRLLNKSNRTDNPPPKRGRQLNCGRAVR